MSSTVALMRDATPIRIGGDGGNLPPAPLDLSRCARGELIYLVVAPRGGNVQGQAFTGDPQASADIRYLAGTADVADNAAALAEEQDGSGERRASKADVLVGRLRSWLVAQPSLPHGHPALPIARVAELLPDGGVLLDDAFVPPVTRVAAAPSLDYWLRDLIALAKSRADQLARRVGKIEPNMESTIELQLVQCVSRYEAALRSVLLTDAHPIEAYRTMLQMAGELAAFSSRRGQTTLNAYSHGALGECFLPLVDELRMLLANLPIDGTVDLEPTKNEDRQTWVAQVKDRTLFDRAEFVLAAKASDTDRLALLPEQLIVADADLIDERSSAVAVKLAPVRPQGVPRIDKCVYFHLQPEGRAWEELKGGSAVIALFVDHLHRDFPDLELMLWAVPRA
ncbi:MAG: type VI secretion system baseplate subunit TssK [Pseudomonadota bacterium]